MTSQAAVYSKQHPSGICPIMEPCCYVTYDNLAGSLNSSWPGGLAKMGHF